MRSIQDEQSKFFKMEKMGHEEKALGKRNSGNETSMTLWIL